MDRSVMLQTSATSALYWVERTKVYSSAEPLFSRAFTPPCINPGSTRLIHSNSSCPSRVRQVKQALDFSAPQPVSALQLISIFKLELVSALTNGAPLVVNISVPFPTPLQRNGVLEDSLCSQSKQILELCGRKKG